MTDTTEPKPLGFIHPGNFARLERGEPVAIRKDGWNGEPDQLPVYAQPSRECLQQSAEITAALDRMDGLLDPSRKLLAVGADSATAVGSRADMALIRAALQAAPPAPAAVAVPDGFALVPKRLTRAMERVLTADEEGWQWEDLLAAAEAITEQEYAALAAAPAQAVAAPGQEPAAFARLAGGDFVHAVSPREKVESPEVWADHDVPLYAAPALDRVELAERIKKEAAHWAYMAEIDNGDAANVARDKHAELIAQLAAAPAQAVVVPSEDEGTLFDYAMVIAHERELHVKGHKHDSDGAVLRFRSAVRRALAAPAHATNLDALSQLMLGMSVSVDVSTGDHDSGNRYFGEVTEVQEDGQGKHRVILLVQDPEPNFTPPAQEHATQLAGQGPDLREHLRWSLQRIRRLDHETGDASCGARFSGAVAALERADAMCAWSSDAAAPAQAQEDARDPVRALIATHAEMLADNAYAYFELAYTRQTGWMAWITDKPLYGAPVVNPDRKVLAQGQGDTPDEACADAARAAKGGAA